MTRVQHYQNQLQFNLDSCQASPGMAHFKFHSPHPIVVEKFGPAVPGTTPINISPISKSAFTFTNVSQDKMSLAIQLARRDIKKQKEEEEMEKSLSKHRKDKNRNKEDPHNKARVVHSREYKERMKKRKEKHQRALPVKVGVRGRLIQSHSTQTGRNRGSPSRATQHSVLHLSQSNNSDMPATSMSPPTRDTDPYRLSSQEERTMHEIQKLRTEMNKCLTQIKEIDDLAKKGGIVAQPRPIVGQEDLPPAELARRRAARAEEQATRTTRTLYSLHQQVKDIQTDLAKVNQGELKGSKKNHLLTRLASAHRGSVRALKSLVDQLADHDLKQGLPKSYRELSLLVRQLSLCCAQLEVAGQTAVPDSVMHLIKDMAEVNEHMEKELQSSPPRQSRADTKTGRQSSPVQRELFEPHEPSSKGLKQGARGPVSKQIIIHGGKGHLTGNDSRIGAETVNKISQDINQRAAGSSPEREAALRQGVMALMRAADDTPRSAPARVPPLNLPVTPRDVERQQAGRGRKGLLLPSKLAAKRERAAQVRHQQQAIALLQGGHPHYAEPTVSHQLKMNPHVERSQSPGRPQHSTNALSGRSQSPGRPQHLMNALSGRSQSPGRPLAHFTPRSPTPRSPSRTASGRSRMPAGGPWDIAREEIARQVWLDKEAKRQVRDMEKRKAGIEKLDRLRSDIGTPKRWVAEAEEKIKSQLRPLIEQAKVETNADILADMILHDVLDETVDDLSRLEEDEDGDVTQEAMAMQDAPSLEVMLHRLKDMEDEQLQIRRRWATIVYEDESSHRVRRATYLDADGSECPGTPAPIEVIGGEVQQTHTKITFEDPYRQMKEAPKEEIEPIRFTKPPHPGPYHQSLHLSQLGLEHDHQGAAPEPRAELKDTRRPLYLSEEMIDSLEGYRVRFEEHLRRTSTHTVGRFNPWQLVEEMSNEILDECLTDVAKELEDINNDIVGHIYQSEFKELPNSEKDDTPKNLDKSENDGVLGIYEN